MSLFEVVDDLFSEPADHVSVARCIDRIETRHGGYEKWAAGCICGWYDKGVPGCSFIPSKESADRLYKEHLIRSGVRPADEVGLEPTDQEPEVEYHYSPTGQRHPGFGYVIPQTVREVLGLP